MAYVAKIKLVEVDEVPVCPYCEEELNEIKVNARQAPWPLVEKQNVCFCPHCPPAHSDQQWLHARWLTAWRNFRR
jgi:uncharacterized protein with PIN domain